MKRACSDVLQGAALKIFQGASPQNFCKAKTSDTPSMKLCKLTPCVDLTRTCPHRVLRCGNEASKAQNQTVCQHSRKVVPLFAVRHICSGFGVVMVPWPPRSTYGHTIVNNFFSNFIVWNSILHTTNVNLSLMK